VFLEIEEIRDNDNENRIEGREGGIKIEIEIETSVLPLRMLRFRCTYLRLLIFHLIDFHFSK